MGKAKMTVQAAGVEDAVSGTFVAHPPGARTPSWCRAFGGRLEPLCSLPYLSVEFRVVLALLSWKNGKGALTQSLLAQFVWATPTGVRMAMQKLLASGLVISMGAPSAKLYQLSPEFFFSGDSADWAAACRLAKNFDPAPEAPVRKKREKKEKRVPDASIGARLRQARLASENE